MQETTYQDLSEQDKQLLNSATLVMETAYNPYSNFYVGAALLSRNDQIITGSNVENAAYGSTLCAERAAILKANSKGIRKFKKLALIARGEKSEMKEPMRLCGSCRQMLYEVSQISGCDLEIIASSTKKDKIILTTINEILPLAFGPLELGIDISRYRR